MEEMFAGQLLAARAARVTNPQAKEGTDSGAAWDGGHKQSVVRFEDLLDFVEVKIKVRCMRSALRCRARHRLVLVARKTLSRDWRQP